MSKVQIEKNTLKNLLAIVEAYQRAYADVISEEPNKMLLALIEETKEVLED